MMQDNDTKRVAMVALMINGQPCQTPLATFDNDLLCELKRMIMDELGKCDTCCARRAKLYDFVADINYILSKMATVALCRN